VFGLVYFVREHHSSRHISPTTYMEPLLDASQNVNVLSGNITDGRTYVRFSRTLDTGDSGDDIIFDGEACAFLIFSWGGTVNGNGIDAMLTQHAQSEAPGIRQCFTSCDDMRKSCIFGIFKLAICFVENKLPGN